ncbi:YbbR-like domain-containing protein [Ruminococcus flavefaciens]|uniref:CdaR family protein n=1 Tax=Ruminococcus flavefaciens TaxID=1265 RepID=UPI0026EBE970|nr:CdaR family protein [Ruminococcus flavefaciens]
MNENRKRGINETTNNATLLLIAIICAVAAWFIVAMTIYPSESKTITDIPLIMDITGTSAAENGLSITNRNVEKVTVSFDCSRTNYNRINADDIRAYVNFDNITTEGKKTLTIQVDSDNGMELTNLKVYPETVEVELNKFEIKTINVKPKLTNVTLAEGKVFGDIKCQPEEITITGPSSKLAQIAECYAVSEKTLTDLDTSYSGLNSDRLEFIDAEGNPLIDTQFITTDPATVNISMQVLTQKTLPFKVNLKLPQNSDFDKDSLKFDITPAELTIASGSSDVTLTDDPLEIPISLSAVDIGFSKDYNIENMLSAKNVINVSGIENVKVTLNDEGLASKEITLAGGNVKLLHVPNDGYNYSIETAKITFKLIGPADVIDDIIAADLDATVNFLGEDTSKNPDLFEYYVDVSCSTHNNVWCFNAPKVNIRKTAKEGAVKQSSSSVSTSSKTN